MMSANPIGNAVVHNLDNVAVPALVAENLPGKTGPGGKGPIFTAPAAPSLTAEPTAPNAEGGNIVLNWNSVSGAASYVVEVWVPARRTVVDGRAAGVVAAHWEQIASPGSGTTSYTFNVGQNYTQEYTFRVGATNPGGTTWSASVSSTAKCVTFTETF